MDLTVALTFVVSGFGAGWALATLASFRFLRKRLKRLGLLPYVAGYEQGIRDTEAALLNHFRGDRRVESAIEDVRSRRPH